MPSTDLKRREKEQRRSYILDVAEKLLFSRGYDKVSMDDIAREIGLNKATIYTHFENKQTLFSAVVLRGARILNALIKEKINKCSTGIEVLDAIGIAYFEFVNKYPDYNRAYLYFKSDRFSSEDYQDLGDEAKEILELRREEFDITCNAIKSGIRDGKFRSDLDPVEVSVFLTLVIKALSEMRSDFRRVLEMRGISEHRFFADVAGFMHLMLTNKEKKDENI